MAKHALKKRRHRGGNHRRGPAAGISTPQRSPQPASRHGVTASRSARAFTAVGALGTTTLLTFGVNAPEAVAAAATPATCPADGCVYIVKGTNSPVHPVPDSAYPQFAYVYDRAVGAPAPQPVTTPYPYYLVPYPAALWPVTPPDYISSPTFDQSVAAGVTNLEQLRPLNANSPNDVLWGYSQGATVVTGYKQAYNAQTNPPAGPPTFVLVANPNRPNGGILERGAAFGTIPVFGLTFGNPTPTTTAGAPAGTTTTYDIARQYDGIADAPENPLNVVADLNAAMGFYYLHGHYVDVDPATAGLIDQGTYGDTHYYLIPTYPLPLLMPLESIPVVGSPLADTLDPPLRVIVESAYDRSRSPGQPTPANPLYFPDPATLGTNAAAAVPTGIDNGVSDLAGGLRPLGTARPDPLGAPAPSPTPSSSGAVTSFAAPNSSAAQANSTTMSNQQSTPRSALTGAVPAMSTATAPLQSASSGTAAAKGNLSPQPQSVAPSAPAKTSSTAGAGGLPGRLSSVVSTATKAVTSASAKHSKTG